MRDCQIHGSIIIVKEWNVQIIYINTEKDDNFAVWLVKRSSEKACVDTSLDSAVIINLVIQKTKRLTFGFALIVFFFWRKSSSADKIWLVECQSFFSIKSKSAKYSIHIKINSQVHDWSEDVWASYPYAQNALLADYSWFI